MANGPSRRLAESARHGSSERPLTAALAVVLVAGVVVPGVAQYWLRSAGYSLAGDVVWVVGYATAALVVWWGWIRPLDLTGPTGGQR